jgi:hypothetical protein
MKQIVAILLVILIGGIIGASTAMHHSEIMSSFLDLMPSVLIGIGVGLFLVGAGGVLGSIPRVFSTRTKADYKACRNELMNVFTYGISIILGIFVLVAGILLGR